MFEIGRPDLDWTSLAKGMGVPATRVTSLDAFGKALKAGLESEGPTLIEVPLERFKGKEPGGSASLGAGVSAAILASSPLMTFPVGVSGMEDTSRICDGRLYGARC